MIIAQITDIHINEKEHLPFEVDVKNNFKKILRKLNEYEFDCLVFTGDLCFRDAKPEIYEWVKNQVTERIQKPCYYIAGNHDHSGMLATMFNLEAEVVGEELYYTRFLGNLKALFLDTAIGVMSDKQKNWVRNQLDDDSKRVLVFMHHPPLIAGVPHMDQKYALTDMDEVMDIFKKSNKLIDIFCGHYHVEKAFNTGNINIYITPSCFVQIDSRFSEFKPDHFKPAFRIIEANDQILSTSVHYQFD